MYVDIHVHIVALSPGTPNFSAYNIEESEVAGDKAIYIFLCGCMIGVL